MPATAPIARPNPMPRLLAGLFLALFLAALPGVVRAEMPEVRPSGHAVPQKGPLISELREDLSPEVDGAETIIRRYEDAQGNQVREFIMNNAVFQIQVIPRNGIPYYLIDADGDGLFENRFRGYEPSLIIPQWVLFRF